MVSFFGLLVRIFAGRRVRHPRRDTHSIESRIETLSALAITRGTTAGEVLWVLDGDTVDVRVDGHTIRVRLASIDCPEDGQPWGNTARAGLIKLIGGKRVHLEVHGIDDYGRMLATPFTRHGPEGKLTNVNERMIMLGHAWVLRGHCAHLSLGRQRQLFRLEAWARSKNVGLWRTPDPVPPWMWRRRQ